MFRCDFILKARSGNATLKVVDNLTVCSARQSGGEKEEKKKRRRRRRRRRRKRRRGGGGRSRRSGLHGGENATEQPEQEAAAAAAAPPGWEGAGGKEGGKTHLEENRAPLRQTAVLQSNCEAPRFKISGAWGHYVV